MEVKRDLLQQPLIVINVGLKGFAENLEKQEVEVIQVDWKPPAGRRSRYDRPARRTSLAEIYVEVQTSWLQE
jgi:hypothetical protein